MTPVSETATAGVPAAFSFDLSVVGGSDHRGRVALRAGRHDRGVAVARRCSRRDAAAARRRRARPRRGLRSTRRIVRWNSGAEVVTDEECTTTVSAELDSPAKPRWISVRACTDSEPSACQPAPDSAVSTFGAKARERDGDDRPHGQDRARVIGGEAAEPADRADSATARPPPPRRDEPVRRSSPSSAPLDPDQAMLGG